MTNLAGRLHEQKTLQRIMDSGQAEFLALYGRRRVGKTFLINNFFRGQCPIFELTGIRGAKRATQLNNFANEFGDVFRDGQRQSTPKDWFDAFDTLRRELKNTLSKDKNRFVIFLDELPWLASQRSGFLEALGHFWNRYASRYEQVIVVVCGSAASWMLKKVVSDKGGLHGRLTERIRLLPFTLRETESFLNLKNIRLTRKQIVEVFMAFGGIPKYLDQIRPEYSAAQAINQVCFSSTGYLRDEFKDLYRSLFEHSELHLNVIRILAQRMTGLTLNEVRDQVGVSSGGRFSTAIKELEESGFISRIYPWNRHKKGVRLRLCDEYSLFYLKWIESAPAATIVADPDYWLKRQSTPAFRSWAGLAFEGICFKHIESIKIALGIPGVSTRHYGWVFQPKPSARGAQIDLVIDRSDDCINLIEIKFHNTVFKIQRDYAQKLEDKRTRFLQETGTRKNVFVTMLTTYGTESDESYRRIISNQLTLDDLFLG